MRNILLAGIFLVFTISNAQAWDFEPRVEVGATVLTMSDDSDSDAVLGGKFIVGDKNFPVYLWGSYDAPETNIMAQSVGDSNIAGFGLGYEYKFDKDFGIFVEAGYGKVDYTPDRVIQDEMVYTVIVADWSQEQLDASDINCAYNNLDGTKECYQGGSDLKSSFLGRVGIGYQVWEHVKITAAYRYMRTNFDLTLTDSGSRSGNTGTTYSDTYDLNLDAFELGVMFTW